MKTFVTALFCLCLAGSVSAQADISKEFSVSSGELLDIHLRAGGSIDIEGWDEDRATIEVTFRGCDPDDFEFDISKGRSGIDIDSDYRRRVNRSNIRVSVMVPRKFDLKLKTSGGGIAIANIEGSIRGTTAGGELDLRHLAGQIDLTTGGGEITLRDSRLDGEVKTGGGPVLVENVEGDIHATSGGGNVVYRDVTTPDRTYPDGLVYIRNAGGDIDVDEAPNGADVSTGGGDIWIRSARGLVEARTGGGDIEFGAVAGSVEATTGAGDIEVTIIANPDADHQDVSLRTGTGDVTLYVPEKLSMDIEIELGFTKGYSGRYKIRSDVELEQETTDTWDYDHGSPRKFIYGSATVSGGKNRILIRTTNGNVVIKYHNRDSTL